MKEYRYLHKKLFHGICQKSENEDILSEQRNHSDRKKKLGMCNIFLLLRWNLMKMDYSVFYDCEKYTSINVTFALSEATFQFPVEKW